MEGLVWLSRSDYTSGRNSLTLPTDHRPLVLSETPMQGRGHCPVDPCILRRNQQGLLRLNVDLRNDIRMTLAYAAAATVGAPDSQDGCSFQQ